MQIAEALKIIVAILENRGVDFALAGGLASNLYRKDIRATNDVDIAILLDNGERVAKEILKEIGLSSGVLRKAQLEGRPLFAIKSRSSPPVAVIGRDKEKGFETGVDIILPEMFWVKDGVKRAKFNIKDFGFAKIPCLTVEDIIIAKLYAQKSSQTRFKDLDDLESILDNKPNLDIEYLSGKMKAHSLYFPKELEPKLHYLLQRVSRSLRKKHKEPSRYKR